jgi:ribosomal protein S18 acetylase RimI-like enzyme
MILRTAQISDIEALVAFNEAMALETEGRTLDPAVLRSGVEAVFTDESKGFYVVAEDDGVIAGGLMVTFEWSDWRNRWFWWIQSVFVPPQFRGRGVYRDLYSFVKELAGEAESVCGFRLYVEKDNETAQRVYEKLGMELSDYVMYETEK